MIKVIWKMLLEFMGEGSRPMTLTKTTMGESDDVTQRFFDTINSRIGQNNYLAFIIPDPTPTGYSYLVPGEVIRGTILETNLKFDLAVPLVEISASASIPRRIEEFRQALPPGLGRSGFVPGLTDDLKLWGWNVELPPVLSGPPNSGITIIRGTDFARENPAAGRYFEIGTRTAPLPERTYGNVEGIARLDLPTYAELNPEGGAHEVVSNRRDPVFGPDIEVAPMGSIGLPQRESFIFETPEVSAFRARVDWIIPTFDGEADTSNPDEVSTM